MLAIRNTARAPSTILMDRNTKVPCHISDYNIFMCLAVNCKHLLLSKIIHFGKYSGISIYMYM